MKIRKLTPEEYSKAAALLTKAFPGRTYEVRLFQNLHKNCRPLYEWICVHRNKATAYIAFSNAFNGKKVCGLHLGPLAVAPHIQNQGIGSELLRFALRQKEITENPVFVLGDPNFYMRFGFEVCSKPSSPFDKKGGHFLSFRNNSSAIFTVGYEPEFMLGL